MNSMEAFSYVQAVWAAELLESTLVLLDRPQTVGYVSYSSQTTLSRGQDAGDSKGRNDDHKRRGETKPQTKRPAGRTVPQAKTDLRINDHVIAETDLRINDHVIAAGLHYLTESSTE
jgi:hypothetical protein